MLLAQVRPSTLRNWRSKHQEGKEHETENFGDTISGLQTFQTYVPNFLIAFVGMSSLRSCGDLYFGQDAEAVQSAMNLIGNDVSKYMLGTAMAGVGLSTSAASLKGVGWKPFAVGALGASAIGGIGFAVASMVF